VGGSWGLLDRFAAMSPAPSLARFWWKWVAANGLGELVGLGTVVLLGYIAFQQASSLDEA
jgi:hypothetical protein